MAWGLASVTDSLHFVRGELVNWAVAKAQDGVALFDAGLPGDRDDVLASLSELGVGADDVRAIVLTHAHVDHLGSAIWFAKTQGTPVFCHPDAGAYRRALQLHRGRRARQRRRTGYRPRGEPPQGTATAAVGLQP